MIITFGTEDTIEHKRDVLNNLVGESVTLRYRVNEFTWTLMGVLQATIREATWINTLDGRESTPVAGITSIEIEI